MKTQKPITAGEVIRDLRRQQNLSLDELGERIGMPRSSLARRETGETPVKQDEVPVFAKAFGMKEHDFRALFTVYRMPDRPVVSDGIPVINRSPAGAIQDLDEWGTSSAEGYRYIERGEVSDEQAFAVIVDGDSMNPTLLSGDTLIFSPMNVPRPPVSNPSGHVVLARLGEDHRTPGVTIARYRQADSSVMLLKDNPDYQPVICKPADITQLAVLVEMRRRMT